MSRVFGYIVHIGALPPRVVAGLSVVALLLASLLFEVQADRPDRPTQEEVEEAFSRAVRAWGGVPVPEAAFTVSLPGYLGARYWADLATFEALVDAGALERQRVCQRGRGWTVCFDENLELVGLSRPPTGRRHASLDHAARNQGWSIDEGWPETERSVEDSQTRIIRTGPVIPGTSERRQVYADWRDGYIVRLSRSRSGDQAAELAMSTFKTSFWNAISLPRKATRALVVLGLVVVSVGIARHRRRALRAWLPWLLLLIVGCASFCGGDDIGVLLFGAMVLVGWTAMAGGRQRVRGDTRWAIVRGSGWAASFLLLQASLYPLLHLLDVRSGVFAATDRFATKVVLEAVRAGISEELGFRGALLGGGLLLAPRRLRGVVVAASVVLFAASHLSMDYLRDPWWIRLVDTGAVGALLTLAAWRHGLVAAIWAHTSYDLLIPGPLTSPNAVASVLALTPPILVLCAGLPPQARRAPGSLASPNESPIGWW